MLLDGGRVGVEGNLLSYFFYLQSKVSRAKYVIKKPPPPPGHGWADSRALLQLSIACRACTLSLAIAPGILLTNTGITTADSSLTCAARSCCLPTKPSGTRPFAEKQLLCSKAIIRAGGGGLTRRRW